MTGGFVFPGQGSQEVGMLRDFLEREADRAQLLCRSRRRHRRARCDDLRARTVPRPTLNRTEITQPVLADGERRVVALLGGHMVAQLRR